MSSDRSRHFPALWLLMSVGKRYKLVETVDDAAEVLMHEWPSTVGNAYRRALEACIDALQNTGPMDAVPEALMRAADEAFICYIRVIEGEKRSPRPRARMPREQHAFPRRPMYSGFQC